MKISNRLLTKSGLHYMSKLFWPASRICMNTSGPLLSPSQQLMYEQALIVPFSRGVHAHLPITVRVMKKLVRLIENEMDSIGGQQIQIPILGKRKLWEQVGRWDSLGNDLFTLEDRTGEQFCLQPTCEEAVTDLVARITPPFSEKNFPLFLYQISEKFRDESNPRFGLLRSRAFLMKDLYSFDTSDDAAEISYETMLNVYSRIFTDLLGLKVYKVAASTGQMGGLNSHEFHVANPAGQDTIYFCSPCNSGFSQELFNSQADNLKLNETTCISCGSKLDRLRTMEIGHTFLLGTKYSEPMGATFTDLQGFQKPLIMGCYGIGLTRLLAACIDVYSERKNKLCWPMLLAPYKVLLITPKSGSKEELAGAAKNAMILAENLQRTNLAGELLIDDRTDFTVGKRLFESKKLGVPFAVVANKTAVSKINGEPKFEVFKRDNTSPQVLSLEETVSTLVENE